MSEDDEKPPSPEELKKMMEAAAAFAEKKRQEQRDAFEKRTVTVDIDKEAVALQEKLDDMKKKRLERAKQAGGVPKRPPSA